MNKVCDACPQRMCEHRNELIDECWFGSNSERVSEFFKGKISKTMNFTAEQLQAGVQQLYSNIETCITELIKARLAHDVLAQGKALFTMEHLMVGVQQELACINDFLFDYIKERNGEKD